MRRKQRWNSANRLIVVCIAGLLAALVWFAGLVLQRAQSARRVCQSIVPLGSYSYDEQLRQELVKLRGLQSVSPVLRVEAQLRVGDYSADTVWYGVDLAVLHKKVRLAADTAVGSAPVLLVGEKSLSGMRDQNGHALSEKRRKEFLTRYQELEWQYQLNDGTGVSSYESAPQSEDPTAGEEGRWLPCRVAAVLAEPSEDIYLSYAQASELLGVPADASGSSAAADRLVKELLLTVQGEENYQEALACFAEPPAR